MAHAQLKETEFEKNICQALVESGWIWEPGAHDAGWDVDRALFPEDVIHWLSTQYPEEYEKAVPPTLAGVPRKEAEDRLLNRLVQELNKQPIINKRNGRIEGGLLGALHEGFSFIYPGQPNVRFRNMFQSYPYNPQITTTIDRAKANRFRVIQQVHFDTKNRTRDTIDLVLLVNGIPVTTLELKTDNKQDIQDAVEQYCFDRIPTASTPLLKPGRCLVHFAVSNREVQMTTVLAGRETTFLPFNQGNNGDAGNPPSDKGSATNYLWNRVLEREMFMNLLRDYILWEPSTKGRKDGRYVFPRYHQLRAMEKISADVEKRGAGGRYLIQHSAGSGKTKTIAWLAHRLIRYFDPNGDKVFDSVLVISDRNALDKNLIDALRLRQSSEGMVNHIDRSMGSKSKKLEQELKAGSRIITCTLQTFPALSQTIEDSEELKNRRWVVIIDEAHSSQHGDASSQMIGMLASADQSTTAQRLVADPDDPDLQEQKTTDEIIAKLDAAVAASPNMSFVAFTATPKMKTIQVYGTKDPDTGKPTAFDLYPMSQAINEGFIKDVLRNYSTYNTFARIRNAVGRDDQVDLGDAVTELTQWVRSEDMTIAMKAQVVVEHFSRNVASLLKGHAKAIVATGTRQDAYDWYKAINKIISSSDKYAELKALVAFSGSLKINPLDKNSPVITEQELNGVKDAGDRFSENAEYCFLVVANKYLTGYDEPRLCAMYVDKSLSGVDAVQTLSRLNRAFPGKPDPYVLDFVNNPQTILEAFSPFYNVTEVEGEVDPNVLTDLAQHLDNAGFYEWDEVEAVADAWYTRVSGEQMRTLVDPIIEQWTSTLQQGRDIGDEDLVSDAIAFKTNLAKYLHGFNFLAQIIDFSDPTFNKRAVLAGVLDGNLKDNARRKRLEDYTSGVELVGVQLLPAAVDQDLGLSSGGTVTGSGFFPTPAENPPETDEELAAFQQAVDEVNDIFSAVGIEIDDSAKASMIWASWGALDGDEEVTELAAGESPERLAASRKFDRKVMGSLLETLEENQKFVDIVTGEEQFWSRYKQVMAQIAIAQTYRKQMEKE